MKIGAYEQHAGEYDDWFSENRFACESELEVVRMLRRRPGGQMSLPLPARNDTR